MMVVRRLDVSNRNGNMPASVRVMRSFASMSHAAQGRYKREEESHSLRYEPSTTGMSHQSLHRHLGLEPNDKNALRQAIEQLCLASLYGKSRQFAASYLSDATKSGISPGAFLESGRASVNDDTARR